MYVVPIVKYSQCVGTSWVVGGASCHHGYGESDETQK